MRTTVDIDDDLLQRLRDEAHRTRVPFKALLNQVLRRGIETPARRKAPCRTPTFDMGEPARPIEKALALADALEEEEIARKLSLRK